MSRTDRVTANATLTPDSSRSGPIEVRPWDGFSPISPQQEAGMRIEPPPSEALATGTMPAATAAAAPPDEPPGVRSVDHGLRVGPNEVGSVTGRDPSSGELVRPSVTSPAVRKRATRVVSWPETGISRCSARLPSVIGRPASCASRSLSRNGTPRNGADPASDPPPESIAAAASRAASNHRTTTALSAPSSSSMREMAASVSSTAETSPERTSSAWAVASSQRVSAAIVEESSIRRCYHPVSDPVGPDRSCVRST